MWERFLGLLGLSAVGSLLGCAIGSIVLPGFGSAIGAYLGFQLGSSVALTYFGIDYFLKTQNKNAVDWFLSVLFGALPIMIGFFSLGNIIGTLAFPGLGTAVGTAVGAALGLIIVMGFVVYHSVHDHKEMVGHDEIDLPRDIGEPFVTGHNIPNAPRHLDNVRGFNVNPRTATLTGQGHSLQ